MGTMNDLIKQLTDRGVQHVTISLTAGVVQVAARSDLGSVSSDTAATAEEAFERVTTRLDEMSVRAAAVKEAKAKAEAEAKARAGKK